MSQRSNSEQRFPERQRTAFLIVGMARSGTTVVQRLLSELRGVWVPPETHFWRHAQALSSRYPVPLDPVTAQEAIAWFSSLESSVGLPIDTSAVIRRLNSKVYLWDLFDALIASLSPSEARLLGEKTPDHARWATQLMRAIPQLVVVGLIRDPREVYRSHRSVSWGIADPWEFAEKWLEHARILEDLLRLFPQRTSVDRYEEVVAEPDDFRQRAARLIGVGEPDSQPAVKSIGETRLFSPEEWWKARALEPVETLPTRWREELQEEQVAVLEWRLGGAMKRWGYEPEVTTSSPPVSMPDSLYSIRTAGARAAADPLPINSSSMGEWQDSNQQRALRWQKRAEELNSSLADWRDQARQVAAVSADLTRENKDLKSRVTALSRQVAERSQSSNAWRMRAEELNQEVTRLRERVREENVRRLQTEQKRRLAVGKLQRLRARRWWRLGGALGRWRRRPHRVDLLARDIWRLATAPNPLPPMPDVSRVQARLQELSSRSRDHAVQNSEVLASAREAFQLGHYERSLEIVDSMPIELGMSAEAQLLSRDCYIKLGEVTRAITSLRLALADRDDADLRRQVRILSGRLIETDINWIPQVGCEAPNVSTSHPNSVLHILKESRPYFERGYTMRSHMTLMAQRLAGFDPTVVTSLGFPRDQGFDNFKEEEVLEGVTHYRLDLGPGYTTRRIPYDQILCDQATLTARLAEKVQPVVIQAGSGYRGYETALVGLAVARHISVPLIYEIRSFLEHTWTGDFERSEQGEYYQRRHDQETRCLQEADFVITIAEAMKEEIIGRGVSPETISVVPNVVDVERFRPREKSGSLVDKYGLGDRPVLGYVSNLGAREGIGNLIQSIAILRDSGLDVCGLVVGDGPERERLDHLVQELNLGEHFFLTGHVPNEQIEDHYALMDLFVVPRIDDRAARMVTPLKPLEAMAMEIPVIASDLPALRELVAPGSRGEVFKSGDPEALAEVAGKLLDSPDLRRGFEAEAKEWILAERTLESNAARYEEILGKVLERA